MIKAKTIESFLPLLSSALWNQKMDTLQISGDCLTDLVNLSYEQAVAGLTIDFLLKQQITIQQETLFQLIGSVINIKNQNSKVNYELKGFVEFLNSNDIPYFAVKGQVAAQWYNNPLLRQSGDIDIYVPHDYFGKTQQFIYDRYHVEMKMDIFRKHVEFVINGVMFELHRDLVQFSNRNKQRTWEKLLTNDEGLYIKVDGIRVKTLSPTLNVLYIFIHLFLHLIQSGVGLRQVCDLAMCMNYYKKEIDKKLLDNYLTELGLKKAFLSVGTILVEYLGTPKELFPFSVGEKHQRIGWKILKDMLRMGNFGHNTRVVKKVGFLHSVQTGIRILIQSCKYINLAPKEVLPRLPIMFMAYMGISKLH